MGYERQRFVDGETVLLAEHLNKMQDALESAVYPLDGEEILLTKDILENSSDYWTSTWIQIPVGTLQDFIIDKDSELFVVKGSNPNKVGNYIGSPVIKLDVNSSKYYNLKIGLASKYCRHFSIFNAAGETLFYCGKNAGTYFGAGFTASEISKFTKTTEMQAQYPNLVNSLTSTNILFTVDTLKELNTLQLSGFLASTDVAKYMEGEVVYIQFNMNTDARPSSETDWPAWVKVHADMVQCLQTAIRHTHRLPDLSLKPAIAKRYYNSPIVEDILDDMGKFRKSLAIENHTETKVVKTENYSVDAVEDFIVEAYNGRYLNNAAVITDIKTPTYGGTTAYEGYCITKPIPLNVTEDSVYITTGVMRHFGLFDAAGGQLYYGQNASSGTTINLAYLENLGLKPELVKYLAVSNTSTNMAKFVVTNTMTTYEYTFEMPSLNLTEEQLDRIDLGDGYETVNLSNVDRIVAIGDSYTESHYTIKDKSWISKVSLLSDYNYDNFAISGDTYRGQLNKIRTGSYAYASTSGMTWEKLHPTHAIMISKTNDTKYMDCQQFIYDMVAAIETTKGLGAIPIIATEYHVSNHNFVQSAFDYYAKKYGGYYVDLTEKDYVLRGKDYAPFWGGSHPGTRTNHLFSDVITNYINKNLPRPYSAIKIFRPRDLTKMDNLDNYIFGTIEERAEKFKEISICHSALRDSSLYDNCTNQSNGKVESEYFKLMSGLPVAFDKMCLIDVILPSTVHDISEVQLITNNLIGVQCYVKDVLAEPYPSPAFCRRFDIPGILDSTQVTVGNTYVSDKSTGATYKVVEILYDQVESNNGFVDGTILICSGNRSTSAYNNSTLTLQSGTGAATLSCAYEAVGLSSDYPAGKQDIGHYIQLDNYGLVTGNMLKRAVDCDKITFLLVSDSTFNLQNIEVKFKGDITKTRNIPAYNNTLASSYYNEQESLISHGTFDADNISYWKKNSDLSACGLTPIIPVDGVLPTNITNIVTLTPEDGTIVQAFKETAATGKTYNTNHKVKVWARYFPDVFDSTSMTYPDESAITDDSFDWAKLDIKLYQSSTYAKQDNTVRMTKLVGLHWTEIELDITLPQQPNSWYLGLSVQDKPIQLAYVEVV